MPARVLSERTSSSNCANAARTPSISFPVDVSSIGSVAERREIPSDFRSARRAKWSYFAGEARQVVDDDEMHLAFVGAAVREELHVNVSRSVAWPSRKSQRRSRCAAARSMPEAAYAISPRSVRSTEALTAPSTARESGE